MSVRTTDTYAETSARPATRTDRRALDIGIVVVWRIRSGIGKEGEVMMSAGMPRTSVITLSTIITLEIEGRACACWTVYEMGLEGNTWGARELTVDGTLGLAEKIRRGTVRRTATATERADRVLKERILAGLVVVIG